MLQPPKLFWMFLDRLDVDARRRDVGAEPVEGSIAAVKASFLRMSATLKAFAIVLSITLQSVAGAAGRLDLLLGGGAEGVRVDRQLLRDLAAGEDLDRVRALRQALLLEASGVTSAPASKRSSRSATLTGWVAVRKFSNGIDFFMCGPRSFRIRMWIGFCPPS